MAVGGSQGIGRIKELGHIGRIHVEHTLQHSRHLLLAGGTGAGNGHLDLHGCIFSDRHAVVDCGGYGYALRAPQLKHGLYVLAKEWGLNGHFIGQI